MTSNQIPPGYEEVTAPFLRLHGAVDGLRLNIPPSNRWDSITKPFAPYRLEEWVSYGAVFAAPTGTIAAATTPLPEPRCDCMEAHAEKPAVHSPTCSIHLRYRHILPGELAKMPTKPEGLLKASRGKNDWHEVATWPLIQRFVDGVYDFAYALPLPPQPEKGKGREVDSSQSAAAKMERSGPPRAYSPFEDSMEHHESIAKGGSVAPPSPTTADAATHALTDEEIRTRIAEWMGWTNFETVDTPSGKRTYGFLPNHQPHDIRSVPPAYTTSLDAIASAEARLMFSQRQRYYEALREVCSADLRKGKPGLFRIADIECCRATAPQRALALIQTIQEQQ